MATYNRGGHIIPTIESVLNQSFRDYELIIVGDACDDTTSEVVRQYLSERVIWRNLPQRTGNQFGPNNAAIQMARGRYIAYLGHDDLWTPDHLAALHRVFTEQPDTHFAISGCICYGPPGSGYHIVTGLFESDDAKFQYFFPPSSFAHQVGVASTIGGWRAPETVRSPVDADLLLRAAHAGMKFSPTHQITVHKFATGSRYLAYARQGSEEQELLARMMKQDDFATFVAAVVARSRETNAFGLKYPDFTKVREGEHHARLGVTRGILRPDLHRLDGAAVIHQGDDARGADWGPLLWDGRRGFRWSGPNPRPKMLLPFTSSGKVRLHFAMHDASHDGIAGRTGMSINGERIALRVRTREGNNRQGILKCKARLLPQDHSIVELDLTGGASLEDLVRCVAGRPERIALAEVRLLPLLATRSRTTVPLARRAAEFLRRLTKH